MLYHVIVSVKTGKNPEEWAGAIESPTFLLDSTIQGIVDEAHAEHIVREWMKDLDQEVLVITVTPARGR